MATVIYSPGIRVIIETAGKNGIVDVSEDLINGQLMLREEMPSKFNFTLLNHRRKYDGIFTPNDIIHVDMKRIRWYPVFSGYLDMVPYFSAYARNVNLTATDSLKRLKYHPWDPGSQAGTYLMRNAQHKGDDNDGGMREVMISLLHQVGGWNLRNIHIGQLPQDFVTNLEPLRAKVMDQVENSSPGQTGASGGNGGDGKSGKGGDGKSGRFSTVDYPGGSGTKTAPRMEVSDGTDNIAITGVLPTNLPKAQGVARSASGKMALTGEDYAAPKNEWYCQMQFPYSLDGTTPAPNVADIDFIRAKKWWKNTPLLVTNPSTMTSVILRAADWGGGPDTIGVSDHVLKTVLAVKPGTVLDVRFASASSLPGQTFGKGEVTDGAHDGGGGGGQPDTTDLPWAPADGLKANVVAARAFIKRTWNPPYGIGGYRDGDPSQEGHTDGLALDCMVQSGQVAHGSNQTMGNSIALWFAENPHVFDTSYVIWYDRIISDGHMGEGWRDYGDKGGVTQNHYDHVHLSFHDSGRTKAGAAGDGWSGANIFGSNVDSTGDAYPTDTGGTGGSGTTDSSTGDSALDFNWTPHESVLSGVLTGYRALMNDIPLLGSVDTIAKASMRSYMAAPNGDFISWFPDYFGAYGTAAVMNISDLELAGDAFSMMWSDDQMVTHQYAYGSLSGISDGEDPAQAMVETSAKATTQGIATVEFPELMAALFNINENDPRAKSFLNPDAILQRFGARPNATQMGMIAHPAMEFWYACRMFQKNWAAQFSTEVHLTFMPEMWPGMLMRLDHFGFQAYVEQVVHTFDFIGGMGNGFRTDVSVIAPSATDGSGLFGLPAAGANMGGDGASGGTGGNNGRRPGLGG